jgi:hypothetical protein
MCDNGSCLTAHLQGLASCRQRYISSQHACKGCRRLRQRQALRWRQQLLLLAPLGLALRQVDGQAAGQAERQAGSYTPSMHQAKRH